MAYCSNCGKKLLDNVKFCSNCGKPIVEENNEEYDCYCEKCGTDLSQQDGFDEEWDWFECNKCGHITYAEEFFCPHCNSILNKQKSFNPNYNYHKCENCGKTIYANDVYSGEKFNDVYWYCDKCNALLNVQPGFVDTKGLWKCKKCGFENKITEDNITYEEPINVPKSKETKRKTVYEGEIHKCPSCGEVLNSFVSSCPSCGYEIRGTRNTEAIEEFARKISNCYSVNQQVNIIRTFPIPNNKEDLLEFFLIAKTNLVRCDKDGDGKLSSEEKLLLNAWQTKVDQCYEKGKIIFRNKKDIEIFERAYDEIKDLLDDYKLKENKDKKVEKVQQKSNLIKEDFKKAKISKILSIVGMVLSVLCIAVGFNDNAILAGLIGILMLICFIFYYMLGVQIIKFPLPKIYLLPLILGYILFIPYINAWDSGKDVGNIFDDPKKDYVDIIWEDLRLGDKVPNLGVSEAEIVHDNPRILILYVYDFDNKRFIDYIKKCKDFGYTIDIEDTGANWIAYNSEGYKLHLQFLDFDEDKKFTLDLEDPIKKNDIIWPNSSLIKDVPIPQSLIGEVSSEYDTSYAIYLTDIDYSYFNEYVNQCISSGFNIDYSKSEDYFSAENKDGIKITVEYKGFNTLYIWVRN